ncbi:MAG: DUF434 domain-containing protein [bacterium]
MRKISRSDFEGAELEKLRDAASDLRYLLARGYPRGGTLELVGNRYNLNADQRHLLFRGVFSPTEAEGRRRKTLPVEAIAGRRVAVDWYNILITVETALMGGPLIASDDGFLRDISGVFGGYRPGEKTQSALELILDTLKSLSPSWVGIYLDSPISRSGDMASSLRGMLADRGIEGESRTVRAPGRALLESGAIVATADSPVLDRAGGVVDLPGYIARKRIPHPWIIAL